MTTTIQTSGDSLQTPPTFPTGSSDAFVLTLWTASRGDALAADAAGVQRVGVDLERIGKTERQAGRGTWISSHSCEDLRAIGKVLTSAQLFARVNPPNQGLRMELDQVLAAGATVVMAPMIGSADGAAEFVGVVAGRARTIALIESRAGMANLSSIAATPGLDEIHIGLNDLALSLALPNRWAVLAGDLMRDAAQCVRAAGLPFGFGGIGRAHDAWLPIPSDLIYAEYARTGATRALIARSFGIGETVLGVEVGRARARLIEWQRASVDVLESAHAELGRRVAQLGSW